MYKLDCFLSIPVEMSKSYKLSKYNLYLDYERGLVYNTITQAASAFEDKELRFSDIPELLENGFLVNINDDEINSLKTEYDNRAEFSNEFHLIVASTLDCQFRCFYCYENHPRKYMNEETKEQLVNLVEKKASNGKNISIVWYGGEPLLDFGSIIRLTGKFIEICNKYKVEYSATMISNGYLFNDDMISSLEKLCINSVQITLDGMPSIHEKRRPLIDKGKSFDKIIKNIITIDKTNYTKVHLRINVDKSNINSAYELVEFLSNRGLNNIDINLGLMKKFGCDHICNGCQNELFTMHEFSKEFLVFRDKLTELGFKTATRKMVPEYKLNSCTMDAPNAYVVDPDGYVYKCISYVGQKEKSIGTLSAGFDENAHKNYSPFLSPTCIKCNYFPICKGGCLIKNTNATKECNIWKYITEELIVRELEECFL